MRYYQNLILDVFRKEQIEETITFTLIVLI